MIRAESLARGDGKPGRFRAFLDGIFFIALALWCIPQLFAESFLGFNGIFPLDAMFGAKRICIVLLTIRELSMFANAMSDAHKAGSPILQSRYVRTTLISLPLCILLYWAFRVHANDLWPQWMVVFACCARSLDFRRAAKAGAIITGCALFAVVGASLIGMIPNLYLTQGHTGWCLGFVYPLQTGALVMNLTLCILIGWEDSSDARRLAACAMLTALNLVFFMLCQARTAFLCSELAVVLCALWSWPRTRLVMEKLSPLLVASVCIMAIGSILASCLYQPVGLYAQLDIFTHARLSLGHEAFQRFAITSFGQSVPMHGAGDIAVNPASYGTPYFYIDNYFVQVLMKHGVFGLLSVVVAYQLLARDAQKQDNYFLLVCIAVTMLFMFSDDHSYCLRYNVLILYLWPYFLSVRRAEKQGMSAAGAQPFVETEGKVIINKTYDQAHPGEKE